jgi:hypothetical protein
MVHHNLTIRNDSISKLEKCVGKVLFNSKTTTADEIQTKTPPIKTSSVSYNPTRQITHTYAKDAMRIFRTELDSLIELKVPREQVKVISKRHRRLAQIESMKKLYQSGSRMISQQDNNTNLPGTTLNRVNNIYIKSLDDDQIINWIDQLK